MQMGWGSMSLSHFPKTPGPLSGIDPARTPASRLMAPSGSRAAPNSAPGLPSSLPGSPAPPQVAAQSPPPPQPRERMAGTEFNRHHQQPPGKPGKVDTLIPVTVSGDQTQGRTAGGQRPAGPGPSLAGAMVKSFLQGAGCRRGGYQVARRTIEVTLTS